MKHTKTKIEGKLKYLNKIDGLYIQRQESSEIKNLPRKWKCVTLKYQIPIVPTHNCKIETITKNTK